MVQFEANLSSTSLEKLIEKLNQHGQKLIDSQKDVLQALADYTYNKIREYVPVKTGQLRDSFIKEVSNDVAKVYTDLFYAKYVEFGTGIRGKGNDETKYNTKHLKNKELAYSTTFQGQEAKKFVYRAILDVEQNYIEIAKNVLREKGLI